jgi:hypothetical protein
MNDQTPPPSDSVRFASWACLGVAVACSALAVPFVLFSQNVMTRTYADAFQMNMSLPIATKVALQPLFVWLFPALALVGLVKEALIASRTRALLVNISLCLAVFLAVLLYSTALQLPFYSVVCHLK